VVQGIKKKSEGESDAETKTNGGLVQTEMLSLSQFEAPRPLPSRINRGFCRQVTEMRKSIDGRVRLNLGGGGRRGGQGKRQ